MEVGVSCLLYQTECHKQVRHSPLIPVKQNVTRETLEYNTPRVMYWPGRMEVFSVLAIEQVLKKNYFLESNAKENMHVSTLSARSSIFNLSSLLGSVPSIVVYL